MIEEGIKISSRPILLLSCFIGNSKKFMKTHCLLKTAKNCCFKEESTKIKKATKKLKNFMFHPLVDFVSLLACLCLVVCTQADRKKKKVSNTKLKLQREKL